MSIEELAMVTSEELYGNDYNTGSVENFDETELEAFN